MPRTATGGDERGRSANSGRPTSRSVLARCAAFVRGVARTCACFLTYNELNGSASASNTRQRLSATQARQNRDRGTDAGYPTPPTDPRGRFPAHTVLTLDIWIFSANSLQRIRVQDGRSREVLAHPSVKHRTADGALPSPSARPPVNPHRERDGCSPLGLGPLRIAAIVAQGLHQKAAQAQPQAIRLAFLAASGVTLRLYLFIHCCPP
jgi:hypothetical protein